MTYDNVMPTQVRLKHYPSGPVDADCWEFTRVDPGAPGHDEARVRMLWLSVDPGMRGWITPKRSYMPPVQPGEVMRAFGVGQVVASGSERLRAGDIVTGFTGVQTEGVLDARQLQRIDLAHAPARSYLSGLGMTGFTAYFGMLDVARPQAGQTVVVSAAAGAVGSVAAQIAKLQGCRVVGIAGGAAKTAYLRDQLGLDVVIDYKNEALDAALRAAAPAGIDVYFDNVGGITLDTVLMQINRHARIAVCGAISQYVDLERAHGPANYLQLIGQSATMQGFTMRDYIGRMPEAFAALLKWSRQGQMQFREHVLPGIESFPAAFQMLFTGENNGKLLLDLQCRHT